MMQQSRTFIYACILILCSLATPVWAQGHRKQDNGLKESDTIPLFRGLAASYNISGTIFRLVGDYGEFEAALRGNLRDRYFPIVELGIGTAKHNKDAVTGITCKTTSPYFRLGCDFNIAKRKHDQYRVLFGARYGFTSFKQDITAQVTDTYWGGTSSYNVDGGSHTYHWAELIFGVDAKLWGPIRLGWSFRYKMKMAGKENDNEKLWYIPGFGKNGDKLGGVFYVSVQLQRPNKRLKIPESTNSSEVLKADSPKATEVKKK